MKFNLPVEKNPKLAEVAARIEAHPEIEQIYKCVNVMAVDRLGITDHGPIHIKLVTHIALKLLRMLHKAEIKTGVEINYEMAYEDAEVVVLLGALLHDIGMLVHRDSHEAFSIALAPRYIDELLGESYTTTEKVILRSEILHAIYAHNGPTICLTLEAGVVKVADALDMNEGRSRISFESGGVDIHSVSSLAISGVNIVAGEKKPIRVEIKMNNSAGVFQVDELLKRKLANSTLKDLVEIIAVIDDKAEKKIVTFYELL